MKKNLTVLSWNVNGIRAIERKGFPAWLQKESPDLLCLQETKALPEQLSKNLLQAPGYFVFWNSAKRLGYSGVAIYTKEQPLSVESGFGKSHFDDEGRMIQANFKDFVLLNIYFPNGKKNEERLKYKLDFYDETLHFLEKLKIQKKKIIVCGDYNTAHKPIDLRRPAAN